MFLNSLGYEQPRRHRFTVYPRRDTSAPRGPRHLHYTCKDYGTSVKGKVVRKAGGAFRNDSRISTAQHLWDAKEYAAACKST